MTPFEWGLLILSAIGTASAATSGVDVDEETAALPGGAAIEIEKPLTPPTPALAAVADLPTLAGPTAVATKAAAQVPQAKVTTPPQIPGPVAKAATPVLTGPTAPTPPLKPPPGIGQILAAVPEALSAIAPLLGLTDQNIATQRPAPISGGSGGGLVGRFAQQAGGVDIGQLLAALPGIRG
jgi:hypothetical protein